MLKYTTTTLKKLEELFEELGYEVRYEKGSFQSGYCLVEARKIAVVNKFFDTEARINVMLDILSQLGPDAGQLSEKNRETLRRGMKTLKNALDPTENDANGPEPEGPATETSSRDLGAKPEAP